MTRYVIIFSIIFSAVTVCSMHRDFAYPAGLSRVSEISKKKNVRDSSVHIIGGRRTFMHGK